MIWTSFLSLSISLGKQFIENLEKVALRLNIVNVPETELCLHSQEFLRISGFVYCI